MLVFTIYNPNEIGVNLRKSRGKKRWPSRRRSLVTSTKPPQIHTTKLKEDIFLVMFKNFAIWR